MSLTHYKAFNLDDAKNGAHFKKGMPETVRRQMFFDWCQAVQKANRHMLPLGVEKRWWHLLKSDVLCA